MNIQTIILLLLMQFCPQLHWAQSAVMASESHSIYFSPTSYALKEQAQLDLFYLKSELTQIIDEYYLEIHAHTDDVGSMKDNRKLSQKRAQAVADYLIAQGLKVSKIKRFTYGEEQPKASNQDALGRQQNRRVDILVYIPNQQIGQQATKQEEVTSKEEGDRIHIEKYRLEVLSKAEKALEEDVQIFDLDPKSDTLIIGKYGTAIFIPANTFEPSIDKNKITILLNEIYKKSDMVMTNFTTTSNGQLLESGGMVKIQAVDGGKQYAKPLNHDISYFFPTKSMQTDMDLFFGNRDKSGVIDWQLSNRNITDYDSYLDQEEQYNGNYVDNLGLNRRQHTINPESNIICINQAMTSMVGPNPTLLCGEQPCPLFWCKTQRLLQPKIYKEKMLAKHRSCLNEFLTTNGLSNSLEDEELGDLIAEVQQRFGNSPSALHEALEKHKQEIFERAFDEESININAMNFYVFSSRGLGSINCDRFVNSAAEELITYSVLIPEEVKLVDVKIVIKNMNSVLDSYVSSKEMSARFTKVPKGLNVMLVAIDYSQKTPRLAMHEVTVGDSVPPLQFKEYKNSADLKEALKVLDT